VETAPACSLERESAAAVAASVLAAVLVRASGLASEPELAAELVPASELELVPELVLALALVSVQASALVSVRALALVSESASPRPLPAAL
jgi:hypothetical protein